SSSAASASSAWPRSITTSSSSAGPSRRSSSASGSSRWCARCSRSRHSSCARPPDGPPASRPRARLPPHRAGGGRRPRSARRERAGRRTFTGGNLGTPLIAALDLAPEVAVAEVSSFQLEWVERFRPRVGCLLNVTPDHLDRHASFAEYREAKARLFAAQEAQDFAVVNRDDPEAWRAVAGVRAR